MVISTPLRTDTTTIKVVDRGNTNMYANHSAVSIATEIAVDTNRLVIPESTHEIRPTARIIRKEVSLFEFILCQLFDNEIHC